MERSIEEWKEHWKARNENHMMISKKIESTLIKNGDVVLLVYKDGNVKVGVFNVGSDNRVTLKISLRKAPYKSYDDYETMVDLDFIEDITLANDRDITALKLAERFWHQNYDLTPLIEMVKQGKIAEHEAILVLTDACFNDTKLSDLIVNFVGAIRKAKVI